MKHTARVSKFPESEMGIRCSWCMCGVVVEVGRWRGVTVILEWQYPKPDPVGAWKNGSTSSEGKGKA